MSYPRKRVSSGLFPYKIWIPVCKGMTKVSSLCVPLNFGARGNHKRPNSTSDLLLDQGSNIQLNYYSLVK